MKLFSSNYEILKRSAPAKMGKRFIAGLIDMLLVILMTVLLFQGVFAIIKNTDSYKETDSVVQYEVSYYNELTKNAYIVEYIDGVRMDEDANSYQNLLRAIYRSYSIRGNQYFDFGTIYEKGGFSQEKLDEILKGKDNITNFYVNFIPEYDPNGNIITMIGTTPEKVVEKVYKNAFGNDFISYFDIYDGDNLPILKEDAAFFMFHYLFEDESDPNGEKGSSYYQTFINAYTYMLGEAENKILISEPYYSTHYLVWKNALCERSTLTNVWLFVTLFVSCLVVLLLPKYLFKNEKTVGYKLLGLGVINIDNEPNSWYIPLLKFIFECAGMVCSILLIYLFPPFNGVFDTMFLPFDVEGWLSLGWLILFAAIGGGIINSFGLFTHYRQTVINFLFNDKVVDIHFIDQGDRDDKYEGRSY